MTNPKDKKPLDPQPQSCKYCGRPLTKGACSYNNLVHPAGTYEPRPHFTCMYCGGWAQEGRVCNNCQ